MSQLPVLLHLRKKLCSSNKQVFALYFPLLINVNIVYIIYSISGIYKVCFSNEFSTFSHKLVYMEFNVGPEKPLPGVGEHATVLTQVG